MLAQADIRHILANSLCKLSRGILKVKISLKSEGNKNYGCHFYEELTDSQGTPTIKRKPPAPNSP